MHVERRFFYYYFIVHVDFSLDLGPCKFFPCDVNAVNCTTSGLQTNTSADRTCGPCRERYAKQGDRCIDIELAEASLETIAAGNVERFASMASTAVQQRFLNQNATNDLVTIVDKITTVLLFALLFYIILNIYVHVLNPCLINSF